MHFIPQYPYDHFDKGVFSFNSFTGRWQVDLKNSVTGERFGTSKARYIYCTYHKVVVSSEIHVDHIDNDRTNDSIENLQLLTGPENSAKYGYYKRGGLPPIQKNICGNCGKEFDTPHHEIEARKAYSDSGAVYCSKSCANGANSRLNPATIAKIKELRNQHNPISVVIAETGASPRTIAKYQEPGTGLLKLKDEVIASIREMSAKGHTLDAISTALNVGRNTVVKYSVPIEERIYETPNTQGLNSLIRANKPGARERMMMVNPNRKRVSCLGVIYESMGQAARALGVDPGTIGNRINSTGNRWKEYFFIEE